MPDDILERAREFVRLEKRWVKAKRGELNDTWLDGYDAALAQVAAKLRRKREARKGRK